MLFSELYKIIVNTVTFLGFIAPAPVKPNVLCTLYKTSLHFVHSFHCYKIITYFRLHLILSNTGNFVMHGANNNYYLIIIILIMPQD